MSEHGTVCGGMMGAGDFFREEDIELDSGVCVDSEPIGPLAGQLSQGEHAKREKLDWFDSILFCDSQSEDTEAQEGSQMDSCSASLNADSLSEGRKATVGTLDVCLQPVEESGTHMRISMQEVKRYYRFSRCCHWLCGM